jgi:hypothetical protein
MARVIHFGPFVLAYLPPTQLQMTKGGSTDSFPAVRSSGVSQTDVLFTSSSSWLLYPFVLAYPPYKSWGCQIFLSARTASCSNVFLGFPALSREFGYGNDVAITGSWFRIVADSGGRITPPAR